MADVVDASDTKKTSDDYWVPIKGDSKIEEDRLVIAMEGVSLKTNLPEIRGGSKIPIRFQIVDYDPVNIGGRALRQ